MEAAEPVAVPAAQLVHTALPVPEAYFPLVQSTQAVPPAATAFPAGQEMHAVAPLPGGATSPPGQLAQLVGPSAFVPEKNPCGQSTHAEKPTCAYLPAAQAVHCMRAAASGGVGHPLAAAPEHRSISLPPPPVAQFFDPSNHLPHSAPGALFAVNAQLVGPRLLVAAAAPRGPCDDQDVVVPNTFWAWHCLRPELNQKEGTMLPDVSCVARTP